MGGWLQNPAPQLGVTPKFQFLIIKLQDGSIMAVTRACQFIRAMPICLTVLASVSCSSSSSLSPVRGKVIYQNQPLSGALVTFHPKGESNLKTIPSTGLTDNEGTFTLTTGDKGGAPPGEYVITIICSEDVKGKKAISTGPVETKDRLNGAYADKNSSKIFVTVKPGENQLEPFNLK